MTEYRRINAGEDNDVYEALSVLDKACVGADGWSAESFRSECAKENGIVLAAFEDGVLAGLLSGYIFPSVIQRGIQTPPDIRPVLSNPSTGYT